MQTILSKATVIVLFLLSSLSITANTPVFNSVPVTSAEVNNLYRYDLSARDIDSSDFVFSAAPGSSLPSWLGIDAVVTTLADNFNSPRGVTVDTSGNIIVADRNNHRIRRISPEGIVSTVAGSGQGFADGASATAEFRFPEGVAVDASGDIIVADRNNHRIRSIGTNGIVRTIAGNGIDGSTNGASATARFDFPQGVAVDALGNIIVVDERGNRIRGISQNDMVTTIAGGAAGFVDGASATAEFRFPADVAIDTSSTIIVADTDNHRIRSISADGTVTTVAGGSQDFANGASATARFNAPKGVAIDAAGNIIVADSGNNRIRSISTGGVVRTIAGSGLPGSADGRGAMAGFNKPHGVAIDTSGNIIVTDTDNGRIRKIIGNSHTLLGTPDCRDIGNYNLELIVSDGELQDLQSFSLVVRDDGSCGAVPTNLALSTTTVDANTLANSAIATISADDGDNPASLSFSIIGGEDSASFSINAGNQLVIDHNPDHTVQGSYEIIISASDTVHITTKSFRINVFHIDRVPVFTSTPVITARINSPYRYGLSASNADSSDFEFSVVPSTTLPDWLAIGLIVTTVAGDGLEGKDDGNSATASFNKPRDVAIDASGNIIVADTFNNRIRSIATDGTVRTIAGSSRGFGDGASATAQFRTPSGVVIDASGNIIVADSNNNRIRSIAADGTVTTLAGEGPFGSNDGASATARFGSPWGIAIDANANIIVSDSFAHRIRSISPNGMVSTVAGSSAGSTNGASATAQFLFPVGVAIDANGNIIVGDSNNNRIRGISTDGTVTTIAGGSSGSTNGASATAQFSAPTGVVIDASGNIIVADQNNHRIRNIAPDGTVSTIAGSSRGFADGVVSDAQFIHPTGFAIDASGNIIVADLDNHRIRKIDINNPAIVGIPTNCGDIGFHNLEIIVSDGAFQDLQSFSIAVADDGSCGTIPTNLALSTTTIDENIAPDSIIAIVSADDNDHPGSLTFDVVGGRDGASFSIRAGNQLVIDHSPNLGSQSDYEIIIGASDTLHIATKSFKINIFDIGRFPIFTSNPITNIRAKNLYRYRLSASDGDSSNLVFKVVTGTVLPDWLAINTAIITLAGDGLEEADDGAGNTASFNLPEGIAIDNLGNIIVADVGNNRIRSIATDGRVRTIAGTGSIGIGNGSFADGASATARFSNPSGVAIDATGNIIVTDSDNDLIRNISPEGMVSTIAGSNTSGFANGASATARFNSPRGVVIDAAGNIIVADSFNSFIRGISPNGIVSTLAGTSTNRRSSVNGASATAGFNVPIGIAIDANGNIIIADADNHLIRNISLDGTVTTIAGTGLMSDRMFADGASATARFNSPSGVAIDASGNIIVADSGNNRIRSISPDGIVTTIAGSGEKGFADGASSTAAFNRPIGVAIDASSNIIVADRNNHRIRKFDRNNLNLIGTPDCDDIDIYDLRLIVSDGEFQSLQSFDITVTDDGSCGVIPTNLALSVSNIAEGILANSVIATISADDSDNPASLSFSIVGGRDSASFSIRAGNKLVIDHSPDLGTQSSYEIIIGASDTLHLATKSFEISVVGIESVPVFTSEPITAIKANSPYQYSLSASDTDSSDLVFSIAPEADLPSWLNVSSVVTTLAGSGFLGNNDGASATARFNQPQGVAIDDSGNIIVADTMNSRIRKISPSGMVTTIAGSSRGFADGVSTTAKFASPTMIAIDALGNIVIADSIDNRIRSISSSGIVSTIAGSGMASFANGASATAQFREPRSVAVDAAGNIIVADADNHRIRGISSDGTVTTVAGNGNIGHVDGASATAQFTLPLGVAVDAAGNIIVGDSNNRRIRSISPSGIVSTVAGSGFQGFVDGASATAKFDAPRGIAIDVGGDIIVADTQNNRIRRISAGGIVSTIAGSGAEDFANGDGASARFNNPADVAIDASGNIIVADEDNNRIRKIERNNALLVGATSCSDIGIYDVGLVVSDGEFQSLQSFDIVVTDDGSCDVAPTSLTLSTTTVVENIATSSIIATINATATNPLNDFEFSIVGGKDSTNFSINATNQLVINHSPDFEAQSSYEIIIGVSDMVHIATKSFEINVVNIANEITPVFTSSPITIARINNLYQYSLNASDDVGGNLVFSVAPDVELPNWLTVSAVISTLAGDGLEDEDNGTTSTASFNDPTGVAIDASGNIIVADQFNSLIRSISPDGTVRTIAGSGTGFADGASATAKFNSPRDVAIDASGNIIVADSNNNRIRKITTDGRVSTIAGSNSGIVDGASATAKFDIPSGIAIDASGNIIVADRDNHRIRKISSEDIVTTIAGSGNPGFTNGASASAKFDSPSGVAIDILGNIIVADTNNHSIRNISADGAVITIAGSRTISFVDGASASARFNAPTGVAIDDSGNIIVADRDNHRIRNIGEDSMVRTIAGGSEDFADGVFSIARFRSPSGVAIDASGNIIVADRDNHRIRKIERNNLVGTPPSCDDIGSYDVGLIVSDGEFENLQSFTIRVISDGSCILVAPFSFDTISDVALSETITSNAIIVTTNTLDPQSTFTIRIEGGGGRYSINDGSYTDVVGVVNVGDSVKVQIVASDQLNTAKTATVSIDDVAAIFTITTTNFSIVGGDSTVSYNNLAITISATSSDSQIIPITWTSSATNVVSFSDPDIGLITIVGVGTSLITARRGDNESSIIFTVEPLTLTPTFASPQTFTYNTSIRTVVATITSSIIGADDVSLTMGGMVTATNVGNYNIGLGLIGADSRNYRLSTTTLSWSIIKANQTGFTIMVSSTLEIGATTTATTEGGQSTGAISFSSSNPAIATISQSGLISTQNLGTTTITATRAGNSNYNDISASVLLTVVEVDTTPDAFSFSALVNVELNALISSNIATITGFSGAVGIRIEGGTYIIGTSSPTAALGTISAGEIVAVQVLSSGDFNTQTVATLTVGSGDSATRAIFSVTTRSDPAITPDSITLTLSATTTIADNTITITVSASNSNGAIDITELAATTVLANATISASGNEITYTPSAVGNEIISVISINGIDVSSVSGSSATFEVTHGALTRIELEPQNPTFIVGGMNESEIIIDITLYDANNNLILEPTQVDVELTGGFGVKNPMRSSGGRTSMLINNEREAMGILTISFSDIIATTTITSIERLTISEGDRTVSYGDADFTLVAQGGESADNATWTSSTPTVATIDENSGSVAIVNAGTTIITAKNSSNEATISLIVNPLTLSPTFASSPTLIYDTNTRTVAVTITRGIISSDDISLITSGSITAINAGNYNINLALVGASSPNYRLSADVLSWQIDKADQSAFSLGVDVTIVLGNSLSLMVTGISATISTTNYGSSNPNVAIVDRTNGQITIVGIGTTIISATNTGDDNYNQAVASYMLTVANTAPTVDNPIPNRSASLGNLFIFTIPENTFSDANGDDLTISISNLPPSLTFDGVETILGTPTQIGDFDITITANDGNGGMVSTTFGLEVTDRLIINSDNPRKAIYGATGFILVAQGGANADNATWTSSNLNVATIDENSGFVTITGVGTTAITAKDGSEEATISLIINPLIITPTFASSQTFTYNASIITVFATISRGIVGADDISLSISGATATDVGNYNMSLELTGADSLNYILSTNTLSWRINKANQNAFSITAGATLAFSATRAIMAVAPGSGDGTITYATSPSGIITIDNGIVRAIGLGLATIAATKAGGRNYNDISASTSLEVVASFTLDIDGDGSRLTTTDGVLILRYLTNPDPRIFTTTGATTTIAIDEQTIKNTLAAAYNGNILDIDGNRETEANSDGMLIMRYLADQENLYVDDLVGDNPTRNAEEIREYLEDIY